MTPPSPSEPAAAHGPVGQESAGSSQLAALEAIARLAWEPLSSQDFHEAVVAKAVDGISAMAGAIWVRSAEGAFTVAADCRLGRTDLLTTSASSAAHAQLLADAAGGAAPSLVMPGQSVAGGAARNPSRHPLLLAPLRVGATVIGVLELVAEPATLATAAQIQLQFLAAAAELAADYHRQQQAQQLTTRDGQWQRLEPFLQQIHASLELRPTAYAIVNDGRRWIDCDRVSLATVNRGRCRLQAASGVERLEERSEAVRRLEALGSAVARVGEPLWFPVADGDLPPQLEQALDRHLDASQARLLAAIPLQAPAASGGPPQPPGSPVLGVLLIEQFRTAQCDAAFQQRVETAARHAASALKNALDYSALPLLPLERTLLGLHWLTRLRQLPKTIGVLTIAVAAILALCLVPADFDVEARGELQPRVRREVFAPDDAIVSELRVVAGQHVHAGDVLLSLRKPQLDFEIERVLGETQTARKRLAAIQAARLSPDRGKPDGVNRYQQLAAEEEEIKETLTSLGQQDQVLRAQQAALSVTSPIDGDVLTWDVEQLLATRPVQRGKKLLTVGDLAGAWELDLRLPDHHAGYVLDARRDNSDTLDVAYLLATDPEVRYSGRLEKVSPAATSDEIHGPHVPVTVAIDRSALREARPGATVIGKIHCGRRAIGFVWFHDLIAVLRTHVLF